MARIELKDFNLGGESESMLQGNNNSLYRIVGFDLHKEPGILSVGDVIGDYTITGTTSLSKVIKTASNKVYYFFEDKVYENTTLLHTFVSSGYKNAIMYGGYVYYVNQNYLGRATDISDSGTYDDTWVTLTGSNNGDIPMEVVENTLYVHCGDRIATVDSTGTFSANVLDLPIDSVYYPGLVKYGSDLLIGCTTIYGNQKSVIYRWDRFSENLLNEVNIPDLAIHSMFNYKGIPLISAGYSGNIYMYNGSGLPLFKKLENRMIISPNCSMELGDELLLGVSVVGGDGTTIPGIYSLKASNVGYPTVLSLKHSIPNYSLYQGDYYIDAIGFYLSNLDDPQTLAFAAKSNTFHPIKVSNPTYKSSNSYIETKILKVDRAEQNTFKIKIAYKSYLQGVGQSINVYSSVNYAAYGSAMEATIDVDRNIVEFTQEVPGATTVQFKVEVTTSGSSETAPEIESIIIDY